MKFPLCGLLLLASSAIPASAMTVASPSNGAQLTSPFTLAAGTNTCGSQPAVSMGYSLDYGTTTIEPTSFSAMVIAGNGQHILHVKCWGANGAADVSDLNINVGSVAAAPAATIAVANNIQNLQSWVWNNDPGAAGSSSGWSGVVSTPSLSGSARQYYVAFSNSGGEIFHTTFGADPNATHFVYDAQIWITNPAAVANVEMDMNQVMSNGNTVIYGVQCDGYSGTWDYTINAGTPANPVDTWAHTNASCPRPSTWAANTWHRIQIAYSRDGAGNVTYESAILDGVQSNFQGASGNSAFTLGWGSTLLTNFQIDGLGNTGSTNVYIDNMTVYRW